MNRQNRRIAQYGDMTDAELAEMDDSCPECHADWKRPDPECSRCGTQAKADSLAKCLGASVTYREERREGSIWDPASRIVVEAEATSRPLGRTAEDDAEDAALALAAEAGDLLHRAVAQARLAGLEQLADHLTVIQGAAHAAAGVL